jgi:hypothetical protein
VRQKVATRGGVDETVQRCCNGVQNGSHHHWHLHVAENPGLPAEQTAFFPGEQQIEQGGIPAAEQNERPGQAICATE